MCWSIFPQNMKRIHPQLHIPDHHRSKVIFSGPSAQPSYNFPSGRINSISFTKLAHSRTDVQQWQK